MTGLKFEHRGSGNYYKLIFHIGDRYVPVSDDIIDELKQHSTASTERFLAVLLEKVGYSSYLKDQIQQELKNGGDTSPQISALQQSIQDGANSGQ